jgi:hypothetical protein
LPASPAHRRSDGERTARPQAAKTQDADRRDRSPRARDADSARSAAFSGGRRGRGRDASPRRSEPKLYVLESVVDRGFDDIEAAGDEPSGRRVHWTIVKRSIADQNSGKPMSATYVLQRDGVDTVYPNLGAARAAANKTIVHPEKLTLSKAEHVAARKQ